MDKALAKIFSRQPDEIINGAFHYKIPFFDAIFDDKEAMTAHGKTLKEIMERREQQENFWYNSPDGLKKHWEITKFQGDFDPYDEPWLEAVIGEDKEEKLLEIINKIAVDNKPFMDIASSGSMGLAPYFAKLNPQTPCMVTDIDNQAMKKLRTWIDENIPEYNINIASFNNNDMPIKDNSMDYITSRYGISSSLGDAGSDNKINPFQNSVGCEKAISEVYRVLKPGGYFITLEMSKECDYDLQRIYNDCNENGKMFGVFTYNEMQAVCELLIEEPWRNKFALAGFEIEYEKRYYERCRINGLMNFLHYFTNHHKIHQWKKRTWDDEKKSGSIKWNHNDHADFAGFDLYQTHTLFVLRKPS